VKETIELRERGVRLAFGFDDLVYDVMAR